MYSVLISRTLLLSSLLSLLFFTVSCTTEEVHPSNSAKENPQIEVRTDLTQMSAEVRLEIANQLQLPVSRITPVLYHSTTLQGYRYKFGISSVYGGSFYLTSIVDGAAVGIIEDDIEGF